MPYDPDFPHEKKQTPLIAKQDTPPTSEPLATFDSQPKNAGPRSRPVMRNLGEIEPVEVSWLWPERIALGKLTVIAGNPGLGKSFMSIDLAARVSTGAEWPDGSGAAPLGGVLIVNAEDDAGDTIRPRFDAAGGHPGRVEVLDGIETIGPSVVDSKRLGFSLEDFDMLECAINDTQDCKLVVIDPISAYVGSTDSHKDAQVRGLLAPIAEIAAKTGVAIVLVHHLNKGNGPAINRVSGSMAFVAAARSALVVGKDKSDPRVRVFVPLKNNLGQDTDGLRYRIAADDGQTTPRIRWEAGTCTMTADDVLGTDSGEGGGGVLGEAKEWLEDYLASGSRPAIEIKERALADGIKERSLTRAKEALGIKPKRDGYGSGGQWSWALPHTLPTEPIDGQPQGLANNGPPGNQWSDSPPSGGVK